jgi:hypothetical protein
MLVQGDAIGLIIAVNKIGSLGKRRRDTQGDAFFFAFPTAPGALAAASAFTEALTSGPIAVRVGLHTGTPLLTPEGYSAATSTAPPASPRRATAGRCSFFFHRFSNHAPMLGERLRVVPLHRVSATDESSPRRR